MGVDNLLTVFRRVQTDLSSGRFQIVVIIVVVVLLVVFAGREGIIVLMEATISKSALCTSHS